MAVAKKTISLPSDTFEDALARAKKLGYTHFSEYILFLVTKDLKERPDHVRSEGGAPPRLNKPK